MLIDVHGHIGSAKPAAATPARVSTYAGLCGLKYVLVSNRDGAAEPAGARNQDETDTNIACLQACQSQKYLVPLYWARPGLIDSNVNAFAGAMKSEPFAGAVFAPSAVRCDAGSEVLGRYLAALDVVGRPAFVCYSDDERDAPAKIYAQAQRLPQLTIVLCGCRAGEQQRAAALAAAREAFHHRNATLYVDTSHATAAEIRLAIETLGAERVLYGTNAVAYGDSHVPRHIALLDELRRLLSPADFGLVTGGNALRMCGLGAAPSKADGRRPRA